MPRKRKICRHCWHGMVGKRATHTRSSRGQKRGMVVRAWARWCCLCPKVEDYLQELVPDLGDQLELPL